MLDATLYTNILNNYVKVGSQSCSPRLLAELAHSEVDRIRLRIAENPRTPVEVLEILAADKNADVRVAVGINPSTPPHISFRLAFDEDPNVRLGLADDLSTPIALLEKLMDDPNPYVSCRAKQTRELISSGKESGVYKCRRFFRWCGRAAENSRPQYA
ncbi:MAG: hypothetical protein K2W82_08240 [Candidatus Obscuribacterales bacterium]|nr:hypothetical protein [Candidatus Obscuribacterales bacterium]